jgi:hypothetical protein
MNITESTNLMRFVDFVVNPPAERADRAIAADEAIEALVALIERAGDALQVTTSPVPFLKAMAKADGDWLGQLRWAAREAVKHREVAR